MRVTLAGAIAIAILGLPVPGLADMHEKSHDDSARAEIEQRIQNDLEEAGLAESEARQQAKSLATRIAELRSSYADQLETVRDGYAEALAQGDLSAEEAEAQAQALVDQLTRVELSERPRHSKRHESHPGNMGKDKSASAAQRDDRMDPSADPGRKDASGLPPVSARGMDDEGLSASAEAKLRAQLRRAGVDSAQIQKLESENFPKERTQQAVKQAYERRAEQEAQEIGRLVSGLEKNPEAAR